MDLTREALEGYTWARLRSSQREDEAQRGQIVSDREEQAHHARSCPYYTTSPSNMAWHIGRWLYLQSVIGHGYGIPTPDAAPADRARVMVMTGRGDTFSFRGYKSTLLGRVEFKGYHDIREL